MANFRNGNNDGDNNPGGLGSEESENLSDPNAQLSSLSPVSFRLKSSGEQPESPLTSEKALNQVQQSSAESENWAQTRGLDSSHARLRDVLHFINPELGERNIEEIRGITFTKVVESGLKSAVKKMVTKNGKTEEKQEKKSTEMKVNMQNIEPESLLHVLNEGYKIEDLIPREKDILGHVSPTTAEHIAKVSKNLRNRRIDFLYGPTGVGKTTLLKTLAYHLKRPLYQETGSETKTYTELTRSIQFRKTESGQETVMVPSGLIKAAIMGAIYQIDEFNYLPGDVQLAISQIVDEGEILLANGVRVPIHPDFAIACTGNIGYGGTNIVNDAVLRRAGGGHEVSYLPENEEIESVYETFLGEIGRINQIRGLKLVSTIERDEIAKIVKTLRGLRDAFEKEYKNAFSKLTGQRGNIRQASAKNLPAMEDLVSYHEQFSFRRIVTFVLNAFLMNIREKREQINFSEVFKNTFSLPPNGTEVAKRIIKKLIIREQIQFKTLQDKEPEIGTGILPGQTLNVEEFDNNLSALIDSISDLINPDQRSKRFNPFNVNELFASEGRSPTTSSSNLKPAPAEFKAPSVAVNEISLNLADSETTVEIPDFEWDEGQDVEKPSLGKLLKTNEGAKTYIKRVVDELLGIGKDAGGKTVYHKQRSNPEALVFKNIVEFNYNDKTGYALLGWRGLMQDAIQFDPESKEFFIQNKDRIGSHIQVYFPDDSGHILIHPEDGKITTISKMSKILEVETGENIDTQGVVDKAIEEGHIRVRAAINEGIDGKMGENEIVKRQGEINERKCIKQLVIEKMQGAMLHAGEVKDQEETAEREASTVTSRMFSAPEKGSTMAKPLTPEVAGRYLKYKTRGIAKVLGGFIDEHLRQGNILLTGPSGTGKSSLAKTYAIERQMPYVAAQFHEKVTESEILKRIELKNGEIVEVPLPLIEAFKYGWVAELREINLATPPLIPFINTLLDQNGYFYVNGEKVTRHPNFLPIATRNPFSEIYSGTKPMPSSFSNRLTEYEIDYPEKSEEVEMLIEVTSAENPELLNKINKNVLKNIIGACLNIANIAREKLKDEGLTIQVRQIIQKQRFSTDMFQDLVIHSVGKDDLIDRFLERIVLAPEEQQILASHNIHYAFGIAELQRFRNKA